MTSQDQFNIDRLLIEIGQFMGSIPIILDNIEKMISNLPMKNECALYSLKLQEIKEIVVKFEESINGCIKLNKLTIDEINETVKTINEKLKLLVDLNVEVYQSGEIQKHMEQSQWISSQLQDPIDGFSLVSIKENLVLISDFVKNINKEIEKIDILCDTNISASDIIEVIKMAKRKNEFYEKFTIKRKIIIGSVGLLLLLITFFDKFEKIYMFIKGIIE